jgi:dihydroorotase/N-acyl-D-amino-acid deacylase
VSTQPSIPLYIPDARLLLLANATLIDGTDTPSQHGDLLIRDGRIVELGAFDVPFDTPRVDLTGKVLAPGFIDLHSHSDLKVLEDRREKSHQGVTAELVGNCGFSPYPCGQHAEVVREQNAGILHGPATWHTAAAYLRDARSQSHLVHVESLIGHGTLRSAVCGRHIGPLTGQQMQAMESALDEALADGAAGFSTGLMYAPGSQASFEELQRLCAVAARRGKLYTTHMRSYSWQLLESIDEQLALARSTGCRLQISHLQAVGRANWHKQSAALEKIEQARAEGIDVAFDSYPWLAGSTVMTQLLPQSALDGGLPALLDRLTQSAIRSDFIHALHNETAQAWSDILVSSLSTQANHALIGRNIEEIATTRSADPAAVILDLILEERGQINIIAFNQSESNLRQLLTHPLCSVISDGFYVDGRPHPRLYGTFPAFLGDFTRDRQWLSLEEAVRRITSAPADRLGLADRGRLALGCIADLCIFDAKTIANQATYDHPDRRPIGIEAVLRAGRPIA